MTQTLQRCPNCGAAIQTDVGWPPWCTACDWGLDPSPEDQAYEGRVERWWRRRLNRISAREHERLLAEGLRARPANDRPLVYLMATLVHFITVATAAAAVLLVLSPIWLALKLLLVVALLGVVWQVGPWPRQRVPNGFALSPEQAPSLYGVLQVVADKLGARPPTTVVVDERVNATWARCGWRRRPVLVLGLPLWAILDRQQKLALLGHELGHEANGDPRSGWYVGSALHALNEWRVLLAPPPPRAQVSNSFSSVTVGMGFVLYLSVFLRVLLLFPLVAFLGVLWVVLRTLAARSGQRAEHLSDERAAELAGRDAAVGLLESLVAAESLPFALDVAARRDDAMDVVSESRTYAATVPEHEKQRQLRRAEVLLQQADATHPPTSRRIALLRTLPDVPVTFVLDSSQEQRIDDEVRTAQDWVRARIRDHLG